MIRGRDSDDNIHDRIHPDWHPDSAADLLLRVRHGDPAAWKEIVRRYGKLVSGTVRPFRLQEADALDAVQTTWLRLADNAHRVQCPEKLGGWLATTARRECQHILRQAKPVPDLTTMTPETVAEPSVGPEQRGVDADTARTLWNLVAELSPRRKTLLQALFTDSSRSYAEVAARPESRPARSDLPEREPCNSCKTNATNTS